MDEQLQAGLIIELSSWYVALFFYIPKKDKSLQLVQDYRNLNQHTIKILSGGITMYELRKATNKKQHSWWTKDCSNQKWYASVYAICWEHSKR